MQQTNDTGLARNDSKNMISRDVNTSARYSHFIKLNDSTNQNIERVKPEFYGIAIKFNATKGYVR